MKSADVLRTLLRQIERTDEGLASAYASTRDEARRNELAWERMGVQRVARLVRLALDPEPSP